MKQLSVLLALVPMLASAGITADQGTGSQPNILPWRVEAETPTENSSAFGETMTVSKSPVITLDFNYAINSYFVNSTTANGGTATQATSMAVLQTSAAANGSAQIESRAAVRYLAGTGVFASFTALYTACTAQSQQEVGLGDLVDGFFIGCQNGTFGVFQRRAGVDTFTAQSSFSVNKLDGSGPTKITLVPTNLTVWKISFGWHGSSRFG